MSTSPIDPDRFAAEFLNELSAVDDLFACPRSGGSTLRAVFHDIDPTVRWMGEVTSPEERRETGADRKVLLRTAGGDDIIVFDTEDSVWMDVSALSEGGGGSAVYAAVGNHAFNAGKTFIGDPAGLSDVALRRRTEAMLTLALRFGTTRHLAPHPRQIEGDAALGVTPLRWTNGDHLGNIQNLIEVSVRSLAHHVPEIARARYDFSAGRFTGSGKTELTARVFADIAAANRRARAAGAGRRTLQRGILLNTLLCASRSERSGLLAQVLRRTAHLVEATPLVHSF